LSFDFNVLEERAKQLIDPGRHKDAIRIYLFMADGDPSLDGGYLGEVIAQCYEALGDLSAAKYWYGRAVEENPQLRLASVAALKRLETLTIDDLVQPKRD
jgi:tetratricopeptide (TPR) repeat protein